MAKITGSIILPLPMDPLDTPGIIQTLLCRDLTKLSLDLETLIWKLPEIAMAPTAKSLEPRSPIAMSADSR